MLKYKITLFLEDNLGLASELNTVVNYTNLKTEGTHKHLQVSLVRLINEAVNYPGATKIFSAPAGKLCNNVMV